MSDIDIKIRDNLTDISFKSGSILKEKTISTVDLLSALTDISGFSSELLPPNTRMIKTNKTKVVIVIEVPPTIRKINYSSGGKMIFKDTPVPFPWELFILSFEKREGAGYVLSDAKVYAMKNPLLSTEDMLYRFCTPNVYSEHGRICWGGSLGQTGLNTISNLSLAYRFVQIFHDATFNTDLHPKLKDDERFEDMIRSIKDKDCFDYNKLVEFKTLDKTLEMTER